MEYDTAFVQTTQNKHDKAMRDAKANAADLVLDDILDSGDKTCVLDYDESKHVRASAINCCT